MEATLPIILLLSLIIINDRVNYEDEVIKLLLDLDSVYDIVVLAKES